LGNKLFSKISSLGLILGFILVMANCSLQDKMTNDAKQPASTDGSLASKSIVELWTDGYIKLENQWNWDGQFNRHLTGSTTLYADKVTAVQDFDRDTAQWQCVMFGDYYMFLNRYSGDIMGDDRSSTLCRGKDDLYYRELKSFDPAYLIDNKTNPLSVLWKVKSAGDGWIYLINASTGGYLNIEYQYFTDNKTISAVTYSMRTSNGVKSPETLGWMSARWLAYRGPRFGGEVRPMSPPKDYYIYANYFYPNYECAYVDSSSQKAMLGQSPYNDFYKWQVVALRSNYYTSTNLFLIFNKANNGGNTAIEDKNGLNAGESDVGISTLNINASFSAFLWQSDSVYMGAAQKLRNCYTNRFLIYPYDEGVKMRASELNNIPAEALYWRFRENLN
jgi:hypothetical protein